MAMEIPKGAIQINNSMIFVKLFFNQDVGRIDIRQYFKVPMGNDDDAPYELNKEGLIRVRPTQKGLCISVEDAQKLASTLEEYSETLDKLNKLAELK
ncbi:MAG: hypothetical protein GY853_05715 [PVC group bacterium]|nr:hypothetical protein [PVC group bacterium]